MADLGFLSRAILFFMIRFQSENKKNDFWSQIVILSRKLKIIEIFSVSLSLIKFQLFYSENAYLPRDAVVSPNSESRRANC